MIKKIFSLFGSGKEEKENSTPSDAPDDRIVMVNNNEEIMVKAIKEAKRTLPDFLKFFEDAPENTYNHRVKIHFNDQHGDEHIWVGDIEFNDEDNTITGIINNIPQIVECVESGEEVTVPVSQVSDWAFECDGKQYGNYTVYALFTQMPPEEVQSYVNGYGFTNNPLEQEGAIFKDLTKDLPEYEEEWPEEEKGQKSTAELDPVTLHGLHYTEEEFNAEVEKRVQAHIKEDEEEGEQLDQTDVDNYYFNIRREVYQEWNGANSNMMMQWEKINQQKMTGMASYGFTQHDENNPLLEPIHGVTLEDFGAMSYYVATGADTNAIMQQLGIDNAIWGEAQTLWTKRMTEDTTFTVATLFGQYYNSADKHPKLSAVAIELSDKGKESIEKMKTDRFFHIDAQAAVAAAYEYGIDGAQWLKDNYDITNGDLQKIAAYYSDLDSKNVDMEAENKHVNYYFKKIEEFKKKFAEEQGGNVADDIEF